MNTEYNWANIKISQAEVDRIVRQAEANRAAVMRAGLTGLAMALKRFIAGFRPIRAQEPRKSALA